MLLKRNKVVEDKEEVSEETEEEDPDSIYLTTIKPPKKEPLSPSKDPKKLYDFNSEYIKSPIN